MAYNLDDALPTESVAKFREVGEVAPCFPPQFSYGGGDSPHQAYVRNFFFYPLARHFGRSPVTPRISSVGVQNPATSAVTAPDFPTKITPGDNTPRSTGRKRKVVDTDKLITWLTL